MKTFKELGLSSKITNLLDSLNLVTPTEIQEKAIPVALQGKDIIGSSATGSGKTLAFGLPIIEKIEKGKGIQTLILTPTRELADQVTKVIRKITKEYGFVVTEIYGGVGMERQIHELRKSEIVVGTPGRILDHLNRRTLDVFDLKVLILDEADRMSDMGFLPDVERIISTCPKKRQTMLFSATISPDVAYIEKKYMISPVYISVESYVDASHLHQFYYDSPRNQKFSLLVHLLKQESSKLVMIFCNTRKNSDMLANNLKRYGLDAQAIHGGLAQNKRNKLMEGFHTGNIQILVCTDVAARGLDVKGISHVYNYDLPSNSADYIHRVGRTARAGKEGMAVSIVTDKDYDNFRRIMQNPDLKIEKKELPQFEEIQVHFRDQGYGRDSTGGDRRRFNTVRGGRRPSGSFNRGSRSGSRDGPRRSFGGNRGSSGSRFGNRSGSRDSGRRDNRSRGRSFSSRPQRY